MSELGVGKEIVTNCSKCSLELAHIIEVMENPTTPLRVKCKTCGSSHKFKVKKAAKAKTTRTRKPRVSSEQKLLNNWEEAMAKAKGETQKYSIKEKFEIGEIVDHPKFGIGVVGKALDANKIEVIFKTSLKVLMHNK
ncbi:MAG: hypothetical protein CME69_07225 [Halobacteriovorax sp.]|nr:hypothetical protein [Halobacteriovorax sp.]MEE3080279.1 hypothetical protein [Bdellovibrionota bacterium]|tara:strand:- start:637 stop:1047 length:411 start_codon:yes stop_codon:yes gene_type:complete